MDGVSKIGLPIAGLTITAFLVLPGLKPEDAKSFPLKVNSIPFNPLTTPEPPPTPDPESALELVTERSKDEPKKIVCYHTSWSGKRKGFAKFTPLNINPYLCTHLIYAIASLDDEKGLRPSDQKLDIEQGGYEQFTGLKKYNPNLKTMIGVGGWSAGTARFSKLAGGEDSRAAFAKNAVIFLRKYNFDGLDVNWKYPNFIEGGRPEDKANYVSLIKGLREEFEKESSRTGKPRLLLSMELPHELGYIEDGFDVPNLIKYVDFLNVLTYEYHTAVEPQTSHHAPLYSLREESEDSAETQLTINYTINYYLKKGADPKKLLVSIPTYGRSYTLSDPSSTDIGSPASGAGDAGSGTEQKGALSYYEICAKVKNDNWEVVQPKKGSLGPYAFRGNQWVDYDDADIVREKAKYVNEKGLGGVMFWTLDFDDFRGECHGKRNPIIEAAREVLFSNGREKPARTITTIPKPTTTTTTTKLTTTSTTTSLVTTPEPPPTPDPEIDEPERPVINDGPKKIVCYHTSWSGKRKGLAKFTPLNINPYLCTHLIYAIASLDDEKGLRPSDQKLDIEQGGYEKFTGLKKYNPNLKTMIGVGGWSAGTARFSKLAGGEDSRAAFAKNAVIFLRKYNFDGLDVNWKYPNFIEGGRPEDKANYVLLIKGLREEFDKDSSKTGKPRLLLSMELPHEIGYIEDGFDVPNLIRYVDFLNVLTYEYHTAVEPQTSHHAPLYSLREESEDSAETQLTINYTINYYLKKGADPKKLLVSIPTYGRSYTLSDPSSTDIGSPASGAGDAGSGTEQKGALSYYEICAKVKNDNWEVVQPKKGSLGPYAFRGNQWVDYDDADIVREKAKYVNEKGLGGVMFWTLDFDDFRGACHGKRNPIIEAAREVLFSSNSGSPTVVPSSTTEKPKQINTTPKPASTTSKSTFNRQSTPEPPPTPDPQRDETEPASTPKSPITSTSIKQMSTQRPTTPVLRIGTSPSHSNGNVQQRMKDKDMIRFPTTPKLVSGRPPNSHPKMAKN